MADLHRPFPTDPELSERFTQHRGDFEKLVTMAREDNGGNPYRTGLDVDYQQYGMATTRVRN